METLEVKKIVVQILAKHLKVSESQLTPEKRLTQDLGADSMSRVECVMYLEEKFDVVISDDQSLQLITVEDVINIVQTKLRISKGQL